MTFEEEIEQAYKQRMQALPGAPAPAAAAPAAPQPAAKEPTLADRMGAAVPSFAPGEGLGMGVAKGGAGLIDATGRALGMTEGSPTTDYLNKQFEHLGPGGPVRNAADTLGQFVVPGIVGGAAGSAAGAGLGALGRTIPSSAGRLGVYMQKAAEFLQGLGTATRNFGGGAPPLPAAGVLPNAAMRVAGGALGGAAAGAATAPDNPLPAAGMGALGGAIVGPGLAGAGHVVDAGQRMFSRNPSTIDSIAADFLQGQAGSRAPAIASRLRGPGGAAAGQAPIVPRLPVQVADDPAISNVSRFLADRNSAGYQAPVETFRRDQARGMASAVEGLSDDLVPATAAYHSALAAPSSALSRNTAPVSLRRVLNQTQKMVAAGEVSPATAAGKQLDEALSLVGSSRKAGIQQTAPANEVRTAIKELNKQLKDDYVPQGGTVRLDRDQKAVVAKIKDALTGAMRTNANTKAQWRAYEDAIKQTAPKMNQMEIMRKIREDALEPATSGGERTLSIAKFGNALDNLKPGVRAQLTKKQWAILKQVRDELSTNKSALEGKAGSLGEDLVQSIRPPILRGSANVPTGALGRLARFGEGMVTKGQQERVISRLSEIMRDPQQANTIADLLTQVQAQRMPTRADDLSRLGGLVGATGLGAFAR